MNVNIYEKNHSSHFEKLLFGQYLHFPLIRFVTFEYLNLLESKELKITQLIDTARRYYIIYEEYFKKQNLGYYQMSLFSPLLL